MTALGSFLERGELHRNKHTLTLRRCVKNGCSATGQAGVPSEGLYWTGLQEPLMNLPHKNTEGLKVYTSVRKLIKITLEHKQYVEWAAF